MVYPFLKGTVFFIIFFWQPLFPSFNSHFHSLQAGREVQVSWGCIYE